MIKRMGLFQRRQDLTQTQFSAYWAKKHSPLVMQMPRFIRYVQNHRMDALPNFTANHPAFDLDGIAEMYWHTEQEMQQDFHSQQAIDLLRQDESEFMSHISVCIADEGQLCGQQNTLKIMLCLSQTVDGINEQTLLQALPNVCGVQQSTVIEVMTRPQLPAVEHTPQQFFTLWFEQYAHVLQDFESATWQAFYQANFQQVQRASLLMLYPFKVREVEGQEA